MIIPLVTLAGVLVALLAVVFGMTIARVLSVHLRGVRGPQRAEYVDIPIDELLLLQEKGRELEALGFSPCCATEEIEWIEGSDEPLWSLVYRCGEGTTFALLTMSASPARRQAFDLGFVDFDAEGRCLETVAYTAHRLSIPIEGHQLVDAATLSWPEQWSAHRDALACRAEFEAEDLEPDTAVTRIGELRRRTFEADVAKGRYVARKRGGYRFGVIWAFAIVARSSHGESQRMQALAKAEKAARKADRADIAGPTRAPADPHAVPSEPTELTPMLSFYRRRDAVERNRSSGWLKKLLFFAVSVGLFGVAFGIQLSVELLVMLSGVLLFHELGHALAMRAFGYRDLQILFIPFLGAVAAGKKRDARPWEEIAVLLAGPVPGIVLGTGVVMTGWGAETPWIQQTAYMMLFLNYLNLLPIVPLDGGRIMSIVLFDRFPRLQIGFSALSALAMAFGGKAMGDNILFGVGIALLVGIPAQWKQSGILTRARTRLSGDGDPALETADELEVDDEAAPLRAIVREMCRPQFDKWNSETKYQLASQLLDRLHRRPAGWRLALAGMAVYGFCAIAPLGLLVGQQGLQMVAAIQEANAEYEQQVAEWNAAIEAAADEGERAVALHDAGRHFFATDYQEDAHGYLARAAELLDAPALQGRSNMREVEASTHLLLGQLYPWWLDDFDPEGFAEQNTAHLQRALTLREQLHGPESLEVAEVLELFVEQAPGAERERALARQQRLVAIYNRERSRDPELSARLLAALEAEGLILAELARDAEAETQLQRAVALAADEPGEMGPSHLEGALDLLCDFYFTRGRYGEVATLLDRREALVGNDAMDEYTRLAIDSDRAWLDYWQGDFNAASSRFATLHDQATDTASESYFGSALVAAPHLMNLAVTAERAGNHAEAIQKLSELQEILDEELDQPLPDYLSALTLATEEPPGQAIAEQLRRQTEQARVLEPLLASL